MPLKAPSIKEMNKSDFVTIKKNLLCKTTKKMKKNKPQTRKILLQNASDKGLIMLIVHKELSKLNKKTNNPT